MAEAPTQKQCEELRDRYAADLLAADQRAAAETALRDWEDSVTFYHYPKEHWIHLRTTNPLESVFSGVRLRTDAPSRIRRRDNVLYLVFKIVERLSQNWRSLNGGANLMTLVLEGYTFKDGIVQREKMPELVGARS
jgi:transposase-like protein